VCDEGVQGSSPVAAGLARIKDAVPRQVRRQQLRTAMQRVRLGACAFIGSWINAHTHPDELWQQILHPVLCLEVTWAPYACMDAAAWSRTFLSCS
jgi:hypothetical protein